MGYTFHFRDVFAAQDALLAGLALTLQLTITTIVFGFLIGLGVAVANVYGPRWVKALAQGYVELIRNTPLLVQLFVVFFGLPSIGLKLDEITVATIGLASISARTPRRSFARASRASPGRRPRQASRWVSRAHRSSGTSSSFPP